MTWQIVTSVVLSGCTSFYCEVQDIHLLYCLPRKDLSSVLWKAIQLITHNTLSSYFINRSVFCRCRKKSAFITWYVSIASGKTMVYNCLVSSRSRDAKEKIICLLRLVSLGRKNQVTYWLTLVSLISWCFCSQSKQQQQQQQLQQQQQEEEEEEEDHHQTTRTIATTDERERKKIISKRITWRKCALLYAIFGIISFSRFWGIHEYRAVSGVVKQETAMHGDSIADSSHGRPHSGKSLSRRVVIHQVSHCHGELWYIR